MIPNLCENADKWAADNGIDNWGDFWRLCQRGHWMEPTVNRRYGRNDAKITALRADLERRYTGWWEQNAPGSGYGDLSPEMLMRFEMFNQTVGRWYATEIRAAYPDPPEACTVCREVVDQWGLCGCDEGERCPACGAPEVIEDGPWRCDHVRDPCDHGVEQAGVPEADRGCPKCHEEWRRERADAEREYQQSVWSAGWSRRGVADMEALIVLAMLIGAAFGLLIGALQ